MRNQRIDSIFDALGEPVRRRILEELSGGAMPVGRLTERVTVARPTVSKHLKVLGEAGLVEHRSVGTRNLYALAPEAIAPAQQWLVGLWDSALGRYAAEVDRTARAKAAAGDGRRRRGSVAS